MSRVMCAPANERPAPAPAILPWVEQRPIQSRGSSYTTRPGWTYPLESAWSRFAKFQLLNCLNWSQLLVALSLQHSTSSVDGIDLRVGSGFDLSALSHALRISEPDLRRALCVPRSDAPLLDAASRNLRFCPDCAKHDFHATVFQFSAFRYCPIHGTPLRNTCPSCNRTLPYRLDANLLSHRYACPSCTHPLFTGALFPRQTRATLPALSVEPLERWHDYFFWAAGMVGFGDRQRHHVDSGQFLSTDAIWRGSTVRRRLAFVGELQRNLPSPPPILRADPPLTRSLLVGQPVWTRSSSQSRRQAFVRDWPSFDELCFALNQAYRRARRTHAQRLRCKQVARTLNATEVQRTESGLLLVDGEQSALTVALLGWRMSWEGRHSLETLTSRYHRDPPFGLLEWLSFVPAEIAVYRHDQWNLSELHFFVADLKRTWTTWCAIAACRQPQGPYVASPILLPPRALWIEPFDHPISVSEPA